MKVLCLYVILFSFLGSVKAVYGQEELSTQSDTFLPKLFRQELPLQIKLQYSNKQVKRETNDSTYLTSMIWFEDDSAWDSLPVQIRARGNFRRKTCYFAPLKLKFPKSQIKGTLFEGSRKLKLVLPCLLDRNTSDYVLREYLAYKLYETIAPYHFKVRLTEISLAEARGKREVTHNVFGFLIEDMDYLTVRYKGQEIKRLIHPLQHDPISSIQNDFFEFMIANTDYSTKQQHNQKLLFAENKIIPLPYDFDMCGLVNAPYAAVTNIQNLSGSISMVTDRIYKGYEREQAELQLVRQAYLEKKSEMLREAVKLKVWFQDPGQYREAYDFLASFFEILEDDKKFEKQILGRLRTR
ncbi:hypothetical protein [Muriicola soli]|uniref:Uncharacterized protein n=1 Tax=Muriicola soli TaxID=2507538 RepID=A0A411EC32_9FLAO|nr:hypothetical protein [Muriicola soli]QBA65305.1 hypothetical protein EQY75_12660 [Muriicola soli]